MTRPMLEPPEDCYCRFGNATRPHALEGDNA